MSTTSRHNVECILFTSIVLPSFEHFFFKGPIHFSLLFVFLVKAPITIRYLSQTLYVVFLPHCCIINLKLNAKIPLTILFFCSLNMFVIFQNQRCCFWSSGCSWHPLMLISMDIESPLFSALH